MTSTLILDTSAEVSGERGDVRPTKKLQLSRFGVKAVTSCHIGKHFRNRFKMPYPVSSAFCFDGFSQNVDHVHVLQPEFGSAIVLKGFLLLLEQMFDLTNCTG